MHNITNLEYIIHVMASLNSLFKWLIFFLVICTIVWLSFFYVIGRYEPDTRIKQVGFIEEIKYKSDKKKMEIFYINPKLSFKSQFFQLLEIHTSVIGQQQCTNLDKNSVLIFSTNTKQVGDKYANMFKYLKSNQQKQKCKNPRIFVLKQLKSLLFNRQENLKKYISQISDSINLITSLTSNTKKLSIFTYEEGSLILLSYFTYIQMNPFFLNSIKKIDKIMLINTFNPYIKIYENSAYSFVETLKQRILQSPQRLQMFNNLQFIMVSTLKKCHYYTDHYHQLIFSSNITLVKMNLTQNQSEKKENTLNSTQQPQEIITQNFRLENTFSISTRQMFNIHSTLSQKNYFLFQPFLKIIGRFFLQNNLRNVSMKGVQFYFRYGETFQKYPFQLIQKMDPSLCTSFKMTTPEPTIWVHQSSCFKISVHAKFHESAIIIYSKIGNFGIFDLNMNKIQAFDHLNGQKIYLIQKLREQLIVINPSNLQIHICATKIFSPKNPLANIMSQFDIFYISQLGHRAQNSMNYYVVRMCPNNLLIFPIHFSAGNLKRNPLLENLTSPCYQDIATFENLIEYYLINWNLIRNLIIFSLFLSHWRTKSVTDYFCFQLIANYILSFNCSDQKSQLFTLNVITLCLVVLIEKVFQIITFLCKFIQIQKKRTFACLVLIFAGCLVCDNFEFQSYNYWKMMLLFVIFFIHSSNINIFAIKTHFIADYIVFGVSNFIELIQMVLYLEATSSESIPLYLKYTSKKHISITDFHKYFEQRKKRKLIKYIQNCVQVVSAVLIGYHLKGDGVQIDTIISMYMRAIIILKTFENKL